MAFSFFDRLKKAFQRTQDKVVARIADVVKGKEQTSPAMLDDMEGSVLQADVGVAATTETWERVRAQVSRKLINGADELRTRIKQELLAILTACPQGGA